jgi:hypothetical protein
MEMPRSTLDEARGFCKQRLTELHIYDVYAKQRKFERKKENKKAKYGERQESKRRKKDGG